MAQGQTGQHGQPELSPHSDERNAVVVGGGPTGTLVALYLAQMGWHVSVYERREFDPTSSGSRRSYNIVLNDRGLKALSQAGVELPPEKHTILKGNVRHTAKGPKLTQGFANSVSIDRYDLTQCLIHEGQRRFPQTIRYHFQYQLQRIDFARKRVYVQGSLGEISQGFDLLIGADGVFSAAVSYTHLTLPTTSRV